MEIPPLNVSWSNSGFAFAKQLFICFCMKSCWYQVFKLIFIHLNRYEKRKIISCLTFKLEDCLWQRFCSFVLPALATISAKDLQEFEASQLSFCFSRGDCRKDSVSLLLAVEQVFSSGSSVESRNWWSCAGVDFLDYKTKKCSLVWKLSC